MRWEWHVERQVVTAELNLLTGRETIDVDGAVAFDQVSMKLKNEVPLELKSGRAAKVVVGLGPWLLPKCRLIVEGREMTPRVSGGSGVEWWHWLFIGACLILPILTLGGAVPGAVGFGSAAMNYGIARKDDMSTLSKAVAMSIITLIAWAAVLALLVAVGSMQKE